MLVHQLDMEGAVCGEADSGGISALMFRPQAMSFQERKLHAQTD